MCNVTWHVGRFWFSQSVPYFESEVFCGAGVLQVNSTINDSDFVNSIAILEVVFSRNA